MAAAAAYALPFAVPDAAAALRLAAELEDRVAGVYSDLVRAAEGPLRQDAAAALREAAVRAVRWRGGSVAFPGLAERAGEPHRFHRLVPEQGAHTRMAFEPPSGWYARSARRTGTSWPGRGSAGCPSWPRRRSARRGLDRRAGAGARRALQPGRARTASGRRPCRAQGRPAASPARTWSARRWRTGTAGARRRCSTTQAGDGALLLERLHPEVSLRSLPEAKALLEAAGTVRRLWVEPPAGHAFETVAERTAAAGRADAGAAGRRDSPRWSRPRSTARDELAASAGELLLLHGDFRQSKVLAGERAPVAGGGARAAGGRARVRPGAAGPGPGGGPDRGAERGAARRGAA